MQLRHWWSLAAVLLVAGCATNEVGQSPTDPSNPQGPGPFAVNSVPNPYCAPLTSANITDALEALFVKNAWPDVNSTKGKFRAVEDSIAAGNVNGAREATKALIAFINNKYGNLTPAERAASAAEYDNVIDSLWCFVGISGDVFDLNPGDPVKVFQVPGVGGVQFPANVVPVGTLVSLTDLSGGACPVLTFLDCFPGYLSITLYPQQILPQPATVVLCPPASAPATVAVAHQGVVGFEVLPLAPVPPALQGTCTSTSSQTGGPSGWFANVMAQATSLFLPKALQASPFMLVGGVGGLATDFSPFAVVQTGLSATGGIGGSATDFAPRAGPAAGPAGAPPQNPPLPPAADQVKGAVGSTVTTNLPTVTIQTFGLDGSVNKAPGVTVRFAVSPSQLYDPDSEAKVCDAQQTVPASGVVSVVTDANGQAALPCLKFGNKAGFANLSATFDPSSLSFPGAAQITFSQTSDGTPITALNWLVVSEAGAPAKLAFSQAPSSSAPAGVALGQQPAVQLLDALDNEVYVSGIVITAQVTAGGGTASYTAPVTTNADGVGVFSDLSVGGQVAGVGQTLSFTFPGISQPLTSALAITPGPAAKVVVGAQPPATVQAGVSFGTPTALIQDQYGNLTASTATVVADLASGAVALGGTTSVSAVAGVASFAALQINGATGPRTLKFTSPGLTASAATSTINVTAGPASQVLITTQPSATAQAGLAFGMQPVVRIADQFGNTVTTAANVTAALASGSPALAGTQTVAAASGIATFTNLRVDGLVGPRMLAFSSGALTSAASNTVNITAGSAIAIRTFINGASAPTYSYGSGLTAFTNVSPAPQVQVTDAFGNPVPNQPVYWNASTSNGGVLTVGSTGTPTNASGTAQVSSWLIGDGLNQATAGLFAPGVTPTIPGYDDALFSASTPTGISVFACTVPPGSKADLAAMSIPAPNGTIKKVTLMMSITGQSNAVSNYDATLEARLDGPTGTLLKTAAGKLQLPGDNGNPVPVTFSFPTSIARQTGNHTIWFVPSVTAPSNRKPQVWYSNGKFKSNDPCANARVYAPGSTSSYNTGLSIDVTN